MASAHLSARRVRGLREWLAVSAAAAFPCLAVGCGKQVSSSQETPAPSASVVQIGVALGSCSDLALCEQECEGGTAERCRRLAATYAMGHGAERNETRATELYVRACDMQDGPACVFAGQMHEYARGVPKDLAAAARFYERACDMGWLPGCYNEAIMLENGRGVMANRAQAADLYERVCEAGAKPSCDRARGLREPGGAH